MISPSGVGGVLPRPGGSEPTGSASSLPSAFLRLSVIPTAAISTPAMSRMTIGLNRVLPDESSVDDAGAPAIGAGAFAPALDLGCFPLPFPESPPPAAGTAACVSVVSVVPVPELLEPALLPGF